MLVRQLMAGGVARQGAVAAALWMAAAIPASAQSKLEARYSAKLAGITVGTGVWVVDIAEDQYSAAVTGRATGLLRVFASGEGSGAVRGKVLKGALIPASYAATISSDRKSDEVRISIANGAVKEFSIEPAPPENPNRVPITDADKRGVIDPMTGSLVRVAGTDDLLGPPGCNSAMPVFDGRMRYDLHLQFKRTEQVKAEKGYQGTAVVCSIKFTPVAGHVPGRAAIKYLAAQRDMEVWLVPIAGTRVLAPYKVTVPTPLGGAVLEATQFVTTNGTKPVPASARTQ
jgi:hypothetical protein